MQPTDHRVHTTEHTVRMKKTSNSVEHAPHSLFTTLSKRYLIHSIEYTHECIKKMVRIVNQIHEYSLDSTECLKILPIGLCPVSMVSSQS